MQRRLIERNRSYRRFHESGVHHVPKRPLAHLIIA